MTTTCIARFAPTDPDLYYTLEGELEKEYQTAIFVPGKVHERLFSSIEEANQHFQKLREIENGTERQNDVLRCQNIVEG